MVGIRPKGGQEMKTTMKLILLAMATGAFGFVVTGGWTFGDAQGLPPILDMGEGTGGP